MTNSVKTEENNVNANTNTNTDSANNETESDFWVFGYGSLIFKVDFPIETKRIGYIKGYQRRFYQNSIDHRGTIENPGRVVTLVPTNDVNSQVYGVAYKISPEKRKEVIEHLDFREKNGYERHLVRFYPLEQSSSSSSSPGDSSRDDVPMENIVIYVATKENDSYAGHKNNMNDIANQIFDATGPSGPNREYVFRLADAMRSLFPHHHDDHLFELEKLLKERERKSFSG